ncbi:prolipoprotein diacylglyceryl transferase family protein [Terracidiphilus sp.]|uniref:prolipoprotein diacylglyceryl transferase family protein n=1 Tax=Terracidiphilus sp. TaxID=1964191 RepID=UPI003C20ADC1
MYPVLFHIGAVYIPSYGAIAALGVLLALLLAQRLAVIVGIAPQHVWNLSILALCTTLIAARLLLIAFNWRDLLVHPMWMLGLAMIHNPLLAGAGALAGLLAAWIYARIMKLPLLITADVLAAPVVLALAFEQVGALLAGSGYGIPASVPWAVTYTSPLAARWSGAPLGIAVHPVQAYAAFGMLTLAMGLAAVVFMRRRAGDAAGIGLLGGGVVLFVTEFWRDREGRGAILHGALDGPQIAAVILVLAGALLLFERHRKEASHA